MNFCHCIMSFEKCTEFQNNLFPLQVDDRYVHWEICSETKYYTYIKIVSLNNYMAILDYTWN